MKKKCAYPNLQEQRGYTQCCENYRGIKVMSHAMKVWQRIIEARLRNRVEINEQKCGFMPGKDICQERTYAMFVSRMLMEKYREDQRELHCIFVDLEKAYDKVPKKSCRTV